MSSNFDLNNLRPGKGGDNFMQEFIDIANKKDKN